MQILTVGLPLKIRARIQGELPELELHPVRDEGQMLQVLSQTAPQALILEEGALRRPIMEVLADITAGFQGLIVLITSAQHPGGELREMVRSFHVGKIMQHPADPEDVVKALASELGLRIQPEPSATPEDPALDQLWLQNRSQLEEWIGRIQAYLEASEPAESLPEARRAAHFLASNFGSFGLPRGTLLAKEAMRLLQGCGGDSICLHKERLTQVVQALYELFEARQTLEGKPRRQLIVVSDDERFLEETEVEARLQQWDMVSCAELSEVPQKIRGAHAGVLMIDTRAATCRTEPGLLREIANDPFPTVLVGEQLPESSPSNTSLGPEVSAYRRMMAVLRTQLAPALDNPPAILVVDDDPLSLDVIENTLTQVDFYVEKLSSPLEFWDAIEAVQPDLLILDIDLPHLSGIEICRALRMDERYATTPVLFLSGYGDTRTVQHAFAAGGDDFMVKPIHPPDLRVRVSNRLERCRQRVSQGRLLPSARTFTNLEQLLLRSLREGLPLSLATVVLPQESEQADELARHLRAGLRGEDLVRLLPNKLLMVGCLTASQVSLERRLDRLLQPFPGSRVGLASFPEDGDDPQALLELAFSRISEAE